MWALGLFSVKEEEGGAYGVGEPNIGVGCKTGGPQKGVLKQADINSKKICETPQWF